MSSDLHNFTNMAANAEMVFAYASSFDYMVAVGNTGCLNTLSEAR